MGSRPIRTTAERHGRRYFVSGKVCVVGPLSRPDADIDYTFAQVDVRERKVEYSTNCGNMSAAMGPSALTKTT